MTVIEIKPHRNGWKVFEAPGVEPGLAKDDGSNNGAKAKSDSGL